MPKKGSVSPLTKHGRAPSTSLLGPHETLEARRKLNAIFVAFKELRPYLARSPHHDQVITGHKG